MHRQYYSYHLIHYLYESWFIIFIDICVRFALGNVIQQYEFVLRSIFLSFSLATILPPDPV
jgi:hypothetical protein